ITDDTFSYQRNTQAITAEAALDGLYVIRTTVAAEVMDPAKVVATYKSLARVERDFRSLKAIDVDLRPIHHWTETRVRAHVFICMLASYLAWHLRQAWAPLTFTDENRPEPLDPVAPARRSQGADAKAATKTTTDAQPARSFTALLDHLATLTRNHLRVAGNDTSGFDLLAIPTPTQRSAFELLDAPIPLTLK
ncbi:MAG TPA: transposase, partial [Dermatophilaceae bacterium]